MSQITNGFDSRYKFSAKELDNETNYSYFGARYYDSDLSQWLSVDPMSDSRPNLSPYNYCQWNPIMLIDPDGNDFTNFEDENGNLIKHVDDGSNAVFKQTGSGINLHYEFKGFDDNQHGKDEVNLQTAIQEAQNLNMNNSSLNPSCNATYCNYATQNILKTVSSAVYAEGDNSTDDLNITGTANTMTDNFATNPLLKSITATEANKIASQGGFVIFGKKASGHGHVGTLAVGDNFVSGQTTVANIGRINGFLDISKVFSSKSSPSFYTFKKEVQPIFLPHICNVMSWFK